MALTIEQRQWFKSQAEAFMAELARGALNQGLADDAGLLAGFVIVRHVLGLQASMLLPGIANRFACLACGAPTRTRRLQRALGSPQIMLRVGISVDEAEKELIKKTLEFTSANRTKAAKLLGISLKTLHNKLNEYHLRPQHQAAKSKAASPRRRHRGRAVHHARPGDAVRAIKIT